MTMVNQTLTVRRLLIKNYRNDVGYISGGLCLHYGNIAGKLTRLMFVTLASTVASNKTQSMLISIYRNIVEPLQYMKIIELSQFYCLELLYECARTIIINKTQLRTLTLLLTGKLLRVRALGHSSMVRQTLKIL
jgi:hypothetical protein